MSENGCCCSGGCCNESEIMTASTRLTFKDRFGAFKVRCGIGRMKYIVTPGIYAVGEPNENSPVLVSANYKLTFDSLRKELTDTDCWLLILDTKGVNVWCAAGKGTFGTDELINRIEVTRLFEIVTHKKLILPQLGASGVNANEIKKQTGFSVIYGTVRASDIKAFIAADYTATKEMRTVKFGLRDRLVLTPMEFVPAVKMSLPILGILFITNLFAKGPFTKKDFNAYTGAVVAGSVLVPALLPHIPVKEFSLKGWILGFGWVAGFLALAGGLRKRNRLLSFGELLLFPAISAFLAMNFTGSSTFTSPSGVKKEMKKALPLIVAAGVVGGIIMLCVHLFSRRENNAK